jgi:hypothetical protein
MFTYQSQLVLYRQHSRQFLRGSKTFEFVCLIRVPEKKGTELLQKRIFQLTNALSAVKTLVSDERTKVANDTIPTLVNI